jgi:hypothetical protein
MYVCVCAAVVGATGVLRHVPMGPALSPLARKRSQNDAGALGMRSTASAKVRACQNTRDHNEGDMVRRSYEMAWW